MAKRTGSHVHEGAPCPNAWAAASEDWRSEDRDVPIPGPDADPRPPRQTPERIQTVVDSVFTLADAAEARRLMEGNGNFGKIVLAV